MSRLAAMVSLTLDITARHCRLRRLAYKQQKNLPESGVFVRYVNISDYFSLNYPYGDRLCSSFITSFCIKYRPGTQVIFYVVKHFIVCMLI